MDSRTGHLAAAVAGVVAFAIGCGSSTVSGGPSEVAAGHDAGAYSDGAIVSPTGQSPDAGSSSGQSPDAGPPAPPLPTLHPGASITGLASQTWAWVPIDGAHCRDGSNTGIAVNVNPGSDKLMIFLQGGGACFDKTTCGLNPSAFGASEFAKFTAGMATGLLDRSEAANPMKDWNYVFVPYCTGDVHAGYNPNGMVPGVPGIQQFVGYANMTLLLNRLVPTFPGVKLVLLTGVSAGGFGAAADYALVAKAFGNVPVYDLDDSGPDMAQPYAAGCQQEKVRDLWQLDGTSLADCGSDCSDRAEFQLASYKHLVAAYPSVPFGFVDSTQDGVISFFFGLGGSNCTSSTPISGAMYSQGLDDMKAHLQSLPNFGAFLFSGTDHTSLESPSLGSRSVGSVSLTDWVAQLVDAGKVSNIGP